MLQPPMVEKESHELLNIQPAGGSLFSAPRLIHRDNLCSLSRPLLRNSQSTKDFYFPQATLIIILSGSLVLHTGHSAQILTPSTRACLIAQDTCIDIEKYPDGDGQPFQSLFLTISANVIREFAKRYTDVISRTSSVTEIAVIPLKKALIDSLFTLQASLNRPELDDNRLALRLLDLLLVLAEHGHCFLPLAKRSVTLQLRELLQKAPEQHWTVKEAGKRLAMSESTLRRRLSDEHSRFETLLLETRMMHAMFLLQTTSFTLQGVAEQCGYLSYARFAEQFKKRFSTPPSRVR